jgi:hypothetical protein
MQEGFSFVALPLLVAICGGFLSGPTCVFAVSQPLTCHGAIIKPHLLKLPHKPLAFQNLKKSQLPSISRPDPHGDHLAQLVGNRYHNVSSIRFEHASHVLDFQTLLVGAS